MLGGLTLWSNQNCRSVFLAGIVQQNNLKLHCYLANLGQLLPFIAPSSGGLVARPLGQPSLLLGHRPSLEDILYERLAVAAVIHGTRK